jgi:uncharacterized protein (TIGR02145 family)
MLQIIPNILIISKITFINSLINQMTRMFTLKKLSFPLTVCLVLHVSLFGQVTNNVEPQKENGFDRKSNFNVEELKVRWKKAALENCPGVPCFTCGSSVISDIDGNTYNTVLIGNQCWTRENLKVTKYNDGTSVTLDATQTSPGDGTSPTWENRTAGAYTIYDNETSSGVNATNYGFLYNWYAAKGVVSTGSTAYKNLCPTGWHVPLDAEWTILIKELDPSQLVNSSNVLTMKGAQSTSAGGKLKANSTLWRTNTGTNNYLFSGLPGGYRDYDGAFYYDSFFANFWSATESSISEAWQRSLLHGASSILRNTDTKNYGLSVRCLKD